MDGEIRSTRKMIRIYAKEKPRMFRLRHALRALHAFAHDDCWPRLSAPQAQTRRGEPAWGDAKRGGRPEIRAGNGIG
jgi:hypothetical protein